MYLEGLVGYPTLCKVYLKNPRLFMWHAGYRAQKTFSSIVNSASYILRYNFHSKCERGLLSEDDSVRDLGKNIMQKVVKVCCHKIGKLMKTEAHILIIYF